MSQCLSEEASGDDTCGDRPLPPTSFLRSREGPAACGLSCLTEVHSLPSRWQGLQGHHSSCDWLPSSLPALAIPPVWEGLQL